jgi:hypothetical protein
MSPVHDRPHAAERGSTLVEVLASMVIFLMIMVGVLQLFTLSLVNDRAADAKTEMMRKAQMVVEIIRTVRATGQSGTSGIMPLATGTRNLPVRVGDTGFDFWGPQGYAIIENEARYRLAYTVTDGGAFWEVTVFAEPNRGAGNQYLDYVNRAGVRYAANIPK